MDIFELLESEVRAYCRNFPAVFDKAKGHTLYDEDGKAYLDFFAGAGALNYGHNPPRLKEKLIDYISNDGVTHSLDKYTVAKREFLRRFNEVILQPRGMDYRVQFPGPTGTNSVEAAMKLARKVTGRDIVISFTNAFHGMTLGSLSVTGNAFKRGGAGVPLTMGVSMPYDGYLGEDADTIEYMEAYLADKGSGVDLPAAIILETLQAEGGLNVASTEWLQRLEDLCRRWDILLIVDDVQAGCGRTGPFFSFEPTGIKPDVICLSKSISGYGLPMALTLIKPEMDQWAPGEHNATFRGHNPAFITATEALSFWETDELTREVNRKAGIVSKALAGLVDKHPAMKGEVRGRGLLQGIACGVDKLASRITREAFSRGMVMETSGAESEVVKLLPPLTISDEALHQGLGILDESIKAALDGMRREQRKAIA